jgi:hypothetical protein
MIFKRVLPLTNKVAPFCNNCEKLKNIKIIVQEVTESNNCHRSSSYLGLFSQFHLWFILNSTRQSFKIRIAPDEKV